MRNLRFYKPYQGKGAASEFQLKLGEKPCVMMTLAQQIADKDGNNQFGWKDESKRVTIKLNVSDFGEILAVLNRDKEFAGPNDKGLYHESAKGNAYIQFNHRDGKGFLLSVSSKRGDSLIRVGHSLSYGEAQVLRLLLSEAVKVHFGWERTNLKTTTIVEE